MILEKLTILNYKNIENADFVFDSKINCFVGKNGVGKTNVLDAIYHLCVGKSYFNPVASQNITHTKDFFVLEGDFIKNNRNEKILCSLKKGSKKILKKNAKAYERFSEHIGLLPLVIISPADRDLIIEGSQTRRKFLDGVLSQSDKAYLQDIVGYNKILTQRNALLKYFAANHVFTTDTLEIYNAQLQDLAHKIHQKRKDFLKAFTPIFLKRYQTITNGVEQVSLHYKSQLEKASLLDLLQQNLAKDRVMQYTTQGIHKDDLSFSIDHHPIKKFGSQGQQKSFLIALKLAQFDFLKQQAGVAPILLLDDIFDKLDQYRVAQIIGLVNDPDFGQVFISDTHQQRTQSVVEKTKQSYKIFEL